MRLADSFTDFVRVWFDGMVEPMRVVLVPDVKVHLAEMLRLTILPGHGVVINTPAYAPCVPTAARRSVPRRRRGLTGNAGMSVPAMPRQHNTQVAPFSPTCDSD